MSVVLAILVTAAPADRTLFIPLPHELFILSSPLCHLVVSPGYMVTSSRCPYYVALSVRTAHNIEVCFPRMTDSRKRRKVDTPDRNQSHL